MKYVFPALLTVVALRCFVATPLLRADEQVESATPPPTEQQLRFVTEKVLPLLEARCFECHKASAEPKGSLVLSSRKAMLIGGDSGPVLVPGKPEQSILMEAVRYESFEMPPRSRMPDAEVAILEKWIAEGAHWPEGMDAAAVEVAEFPLEQRRQSHWAWQPIRVGKAPIVEGVDWQRNPIDAFVKHRLESAGLQPAAEADRYTLIRRMYFDLIGLPPTVQEVESFVGDAATTEDAMAKVVDRLLASTHFGERWGRHWLDLVRYADTLGHEFDYPLHNAWQYRDYVIRAINSDVPYDDFVKEHIAGDLLASSRLHPTEAFNESIIGTGFWFLSEDKHAPVDVRAEEAGKIDNQIDVFSKTFLGMTVACARCHDHKFDAISTKDYYALAGFLQSSRRQTAWLDRNQQIEHRVDELTGIREEAQKLAASYRITDESAGQIRNYALAALTALRAEPLEKDKTSSADVIFEDFESETLANWEISGQAFGTGTATGNFPGQGELTGRVGSRLVNSWNLSDALKGKLRSAEFTIQKPCIRFLIGGGNHPYETCVNLVVDGKTVRTATGQNNEALVSTTWDVAEFVGKAARIEIVDEHSGGWGHVNVDHIVFCSQPDVPATRRDINVVADEYGCRTDVLTAWVRALSDKAAVSSDSLLSLLATRAQADLKTTTAETFNRWKASVANHDITETNTTVFAKLSGKIPDDWFHSGAAFSNQSVSDPDTGFGLEWRGAGIAANLLDGVSSATLSKQLKGTLASPTFELSHPQILIRVAGEKTRVRLVIDGYVMNEFSELLFGGARQAIDTNGEDQWIRLAGDIHRYMGHRAHLEFLDEGDGWFCVKEIRFANVAGAAPPEQSASDLNLAIVRQAGEDSNAAGSLSTDEQLVDAWLNSVVGSSSQAAAVLLAQSLLPESRSDEWQAVVERWTQRSDGIPAPIPVIAMMDGTAENERVFIRGNHRNLGEVAERNILTALQLGDGKNATLPATGSGRLELAEQLLHDDNPLLPRVAVNRIWHHLFGRGIVESTDNFGVLGKTPTHPDLLDYLAEKFRNDGWSVKKMIRAIMLSRSYRASSEHSEAGDLKDPSNELLHRANIRRLQGEAVRDAILTVSGSLSEQQFGPAVPVHLTGFMQGRGRPGADGPLDGNGRRSIYISVNRNFLSPFMQAFDVPPPVTTIGNRTTSNVPAQALIMLNNEFVNQQANRWATKLLKSGGTTESVLSQAWFQLMNRPASQREIDMLLSFVAEGSTGQNLPLTVDNLTEVCHALLNAKQFLFVD